MKNRNLKSLPVLMHHLISNDTSHNSVLPSVFEQQCKSLAEQGWFGAGLQEAEEFLINGTPLPEKSFLMTFDDGYLDNYVYAWPIMKKYGHKGVIFAVTDRLTEAHTDCARKSPLAENLARQTLDDVWNGRCSQENLPEIDTLLHSDELGFTVRKDLFINWDEARLMDQSGVLCIAGHSLRHGSVFAGPEYSSFHQPGPVLRTFTNTEPSTVWGMPNFERVPELANQAFIPSSELLEAISLLVPQEGKAAMEFFTESGNIARLESLINNFGTHLGTLESDADMIRRIHGIMEGTQRALERELGHKSRSFCWPWGVFNEEAREQGLAAGFQVFYTTRLGINRPGRPLSVSRFKVKNRADSWLQGRLRIYSRPLLGSLYLKMRI